MKPKGLINKIAIRMSRWAYGDHIKFGDHLLYAGRTRQMARFTGYAVNIVPKGLADDY